MGNRFTERRRGGRGGDTRNADKILVLLRCLLPAPLSSSTRSRWRASTELSRKSGRRRIKATVRRLALERLLFVCSFVLVCVGTELNSLIGFFCCCCSCSCSCCSCCSCFCVVQTLTTLRLHLSWRTRSRSHEAETINTECVLACVCVCVAVCVFVWLFS